MEDYCDLCGGELEFDRCDYEKYGMSDGEELVSIHICLDCDEETTVRD